MAYFFCDFGLSPAVFRFDKAGRVVKMEKTRVITLTESGMIVGIVRCIYSSIFRNSTVIITNRIIELNSYNNVCFIICNITQSLVN